MPDFTHTQRSIQLTAVTRTLPSVHRRLRPVPTPVPRQMLSAVAGAGQLQWSDRAAASDWHSAIPQIQGFTRDRGPARCEVGGHVDGGQIICNRLVPNHGLAHGHDDDHGDQDAGDPVVDQNHDGVSACRESNHAQIVDAHLDGKGVGEGGNPQSDLLDAARPLPRSLRTAPGEKRAPTG